MALSVATSVIRASAGSVASLLDDGMFELDAAGAASVAHDLEFLPVSKPLGHFLTHDLNPLGAQIKKPLLHLDAFATFPQNLVSGAFGPALSTPIIQSTFASVS
jgi:hypothetical protein